MRSIYLAGQPIVPAACIRPRIGRYSQHVGNESLFGAEGPSFAGLAGWRKAGTERSRPARVALGYCDTPRLFIFSIRRFHSTPAWAPRQHKRWASNWTRRSGLLLRRSARICRPTSPPSSGPRGLELTCRYSLPTGGVNGPLWLIALTGGGRRLPLPTLCPNQFPCPTQVTFRPDRNRRQRAPNRRMTAPRCRRPTRAQEIAILGGGDAPLETWYCGSIRPTVLRAPLRRIRHRTGIVKQTRRHIAIRRAERGWKRTGVAGRDMRGCVENAECSPPTPYAEPVAECPYTCQPCIPSSQPTAQTHFLRRLCLFAQWPPAVQPSRLAPRRPTWLASPCRSMACRSPARRSAWPARRTCPWECPRCRHPVAAATDHFQPTSRLRRPTAPIRRPACTFPGAPPLLLRLTVMEASIAVYRPEPAAWQKIRCSAQR